MSEFEFNRLLEAVAEAIGPARQEIEMPAGWYLAKAPRPANDNQVVWPLLPFPAGWCASC